MAGTDTATDAAGQDHAADAGAEQDHHHPTPAEYVRIGLVLAVLTALEVGLFYIDVGSAFVPTLLALMVIKFSMVVGSFMHLKFDARVFRQLLLTGLILALSIYAIVLATFSNVILPG